MNLARAATPRTVDPAIIHAPNSFLVNGTVLKIHEQ